MRARYYQAEGARRTFEFFRRKKAGLLLMATGLGKTKTVAELFNLWKRPGAMLFLVHRRELALQAEATFRSECPGIPVHVEMGPRRAPRGQRSLFEESFGGGDEPLNLPGDRSRRIVVATVQSLSQPRRLGAFRDDEVSMIGVDEGHHYTLDNVMYASIVARFQHAKVLVVTATMDRADGVDLGTVTQGVTFRYELLDGIRDGFLVPVRQQFVVVDGLDFSDIRTVDHDLDPVQLAGVMEAEGPLHRVASSCLEASGFTFAKEGGQWRCRRPWPVTGLKQGIVFSPSVQHARATAQVMNRWSPDGPPLAAAVWGDMDKAQRDQVLADYQAGRLLWVANFGILLEGWDAPCTKIVAVARPTKNRALYAQMLGRGTRPDPSVLPALDAPEFDPTGPARRREAIQASVKPDMLALDYVGNAGRHKLVWAGQLLSENYREEDVLAARRRAEVLGGPQDIAEVLKAAEQKRLEDDLHQEHMARMRLELKAKANWRAHPVDAFDVYGLKPIPAPAQAEKATQKQLEFLARQGVTVDENTTKAQATRLVVEVRKRLQSGLCSFRQAAVLQKYGYPTDVPRAEAKRIIDGIAARGWPPPHQEDQS